MTDTTQDPKVLAMLQQQNGVAAPGAAAAPGAGMPGGMIGMPGSTTGAGTNQGPGAMQGWSGWMNSGGVNPGGWQNTGGTDPSQWQSLGGAPDMSFLSQFQGLLNGGANPTSVNPTSASSLYGNVQPYADAAYQQSTRELDPQVAQQNAQFDQQMVNQGIPVGSAAYQQAKQQMSMQQNDAYASARNAAQQQGLAAQAQGFGQGLSQSQLANSLAGQLLGSNTSIANQQLGGNASVMNQLLGGNSSIMNQLLGGNSGIAQQLIGGQATMNAAAANAAASRANGQSSYNLGMSQLAQQGQQQDFGNLMSLLGLGSGATQYNNGLIDQGQQNAMSFLNLLPQGGGGQLDITGPYNQQYQGQMNQYGVNQQNANGTNQAMMNMAMLAMLSSREAKRPAGDFDYRECIEIVDALPVERWRYTNDPALHVGTYAEDFNRAAGLDPKPVIGLVDLLGVLTGAVKALGEDVRAFREDLRAVKARLAVAGAE